MTWLTSPFDTLAVILASGVMVYAVMLIFTRVMGARAFSQLSAFDFAVTLAIAAILAAATLDSKISVAEAITALLVLYLLQLAVARARRWSAVARLLDNPAILVMDATGMLEANMKRADVTGGDVRGALRRAGVTRLDHVHAVVMEPTGELSVLQAPPDTVVDRLLLDDLRGPEDLADSWWRR